MKTYYSNTGTFVVKLNGFIGATLLLYSCILFACVGCGGVSGKSTVAPSNIQLSLISVTPANQTTPIYTTKQFTATGTYSDGTSEDITLQAQWSSDTPSVASIDNTGLVTALNPGNSVITATFSGKSGSTNLVVSTTPIQPIECYVATGGSFCGGPTAPFANNAANLIAGIINTNTAVRCTAVPIRYDVKHDETWMVSAAHCFVDTKRNANQPIVAADYGNLGSGSSKINPSNGLYVYAGVDINYSQAADDINSFKIKSVYVPADYCRGSIFVAGACPNQMLDNPNNADNDIALIRVSGQFAQPESYPTRNITENTPPLYSLILTGGYGGPAPGINSIPDNHLYLHYTNSNYGGQIVFDNPGYNYIYNGQIIGYNNMMSMICPGDSGGPDLWWNGNSWILISIHTAGLGACGLSNLKYLPPEIAKDVSTNIVPYNNWIDSIINSPSQCSAVTNNCTCTKNINPDYSDEQLTCQ